MFASIGSRANGFKLFDTTYTVMSKPNVTDLFTMSYEAFKGKFQEIEDLQDAALIAITYCGYARVGEIVNGNPKYKENPPITKDRIQLTDDHLVLDILTEKTLRWRKVPTSRAIEGWLHKPILSWMKACGPILFPYSTRWAEYRFEKHFDTQRIHLLRHWACTHALQGKRTKKALKDTDVARLGGWTNINSFYSKYSHVSIRDFKDRI